MSQLIIPTKKSAPTINDAINMYARYTYDPVLWAKEQIGFECADWQKTAWNDFIKHRFVAWSAGSGVGKSASLAVIVLFFLSTRPFCKIACTAPSQHQLYDVLWAEIAKWMGKSKFLSKTFKWTQTRITFKGDPEAEKRWFAVARTSRVNAAGVSAAAEGLQGMHEGNILFLCDESSGVPDQVMYAIEGSLTTPGAHAILASNPTRRSGFFYRIITDKKYQQDWKVQFIDASVVANKSPWVDRAAIERVIRIYGKNSDYYRVKVQGIPPLAESKALCTPEQLVEAHTREVPNTGKVYIGVDPARFGADQTVVYVRKGLRIAKRFVLEDNLDLMAIARVVKTYIERYNPYKVYVDVIGIGGGVVDKLHELLPKKKSRIVGIHVGQKAIEYKKKKKDGKNALVGEEKFRNLRAQLFWNLRFFIDQIRIDFESEFLDEELTLIEYGWPQTDARLQIESKDDLRAKLGRSCNDADALILCLYDELIKMPSYLVDPNILKIGRSQEADKLEDNEIEEEKRIIPFTAYSMSSKLQYHTGSRFKNSVGSMRFKNFGLM